MRIQKTILLDIGSSTIKVYLATNNRLKSIIQKTIKFKEGFDSEIGITRENKKELFDLIEFIKSKYEDTRIKIYATSVFRKLSKEAQRNFIDEFFLKTGLFFNIIDQDLENFYLEMALVGNCLIRKPVLLINIGGGSTELVVMNRKEAIEKINIEDLGVSTINLKFPKINDSYSGVTQEKIMDWVRKQLPELSHRPTVAFYSGGELNYMQKAGYNLKKNNLFEDKNHPAVLSLKDFSKKNKEVFDEIPIDQLEALMPENPSWMHGARGCGAISQAICEKYDIKTIIPSDANLIHGVQKQEFRYATLSGSFRKHLSYIVAIKKKLEKRGIEILSPRFTYPKNPGGEFVIFNGEEGVEPLNLERYHLNSINYCDALIVCDPNGYVGASAMIEIGYAHTLGKRIIFTEKPAEFMLNTLPAEIGL